MIDYHIHPGYSIDAENISMIRYCEKAIEIGLVEICFTTHFECDPTRAHLDWFVRCQGQIISIMDNWMDAYFRDIAQCQRTFGPLGLQVKAGVEVGYDLGLEETIAKLVHNYPFDMVMGSVHCVDHVAISSQKESEQFFQDKELTKVVKKYFTTLLAGIKTGLFDVVGHFDLYRRFGIRQFGEAIWSSHEPYIEEILSAMVCNNMAVEINTSSLRQGHQSFYPSAKILEMAQKRGVIGVTIGSDAHRLSELGQGVQAAHKLARELALPILTYTHRQPQVFKINLQPVEGLT